MAEFFLNDSSNQFDSVDGNDQVFISPDRWIHLNYNTAVTSQGIVANLTNNTLYDGISPLVPLTDIDTTTASVLLQPWSIQDQFGTIDSIEGYIRGGIWGTNSNDIVIVDGDFDFSPNGGDDLLYIMGGNYASLSAPWSSQGVNWDITDQVFTYYNWDGSQGSVTVAGPGRITTLVGSGPNDNTFVYNTLKGSSADERFASNGATDLIWLGGGADQVSIWRPGGEVSIQDEFSSNDYFSFIVDGRFDFDKTDWHSNFEVTYYPDTNNPEDSRTVISTTSTNVDRTDLVVRGNYNLGDLFFDYRSNELRMYINPEIPEVRLDAYGYTGYDAYYFDLYPVPAAAEGLLFDTSTMLVTSVDGFEYSLADYQTNGRYLGLRLTSGDDTIVSNDSGEFFSFLDISYQGGHDTILGQSYNGDYEILIDDNGIARFNYLYLLSDSIFESVYLTSGSFWTKNSRVTFDSENNFYGEIFDETGVLGSISGKNIERLSIGGPGDHNIIGNGYGNHFRFSGTGEVILAAGGGKDFISIRPTATNVTLLDYEEGEWISLEGNSARKWGFNSDALADQFSYRISYEADGAYTYFSAANQTIGDKQDFLKVRGEYTLDQLHVGFYSSSVSDGTDLFFTLKQEWQPEAILDAYGYLGYDEYDFSSYTSDTGYSGLKFDSSNALVVSQSGSYYDLSEYQTNGRYLALRLTAGDDTISSDGSIGIDIEYSGGHDVIDSAIHQINTDVVVDQSGVARWTANSAIESLYVWQADTNIVLDADNNLSISFPNDTSNIGSIAGRNVERINVSGGGDHSITGNDFNHMFRFNGVGSNTLNAGGGQDFVSIGRNVVDLTFVDYEEGEWFSLDRGWGFDPDEFANQLLTRSVYTDGDLYTYFSVLGTQVGDKIDFLKVLGDYSVDQIHLGYRGEPPYSDGNDLFFTLSEAPPAFDIVLSSHLNGIATFEVYATDAVDTGPVGIEDIYFSLSFDTADMQVDESSITGISGALSVPNLDSINGILDFGAVSAAGITDLSIPILTFEAAILNTDTPISIVLDDILVDEATMTEPVLPRVEEQFDFTSVSVSSEVIGRGAHAISDAMVTFDFITPSGQQQSIELPTNGAAKVSQAMARGSDMMVTADKTVDAESESSITANDALQALRLAVGLTKSDGTAEWHDFFAADINKDGKVSANDALNILKLAVGLTEGPAADWVFVDSNADYSAVGRQSSSYVEGISLDNVNADIALDMTGILVGDVNGSYFA